MNTKLYALAALASLAIASPAFADDMPSAKTQSTVEATDNGGYKKTDTTTSTDASGTTKVHKATKTVDVDKQGHVKSTVDIKDKTDPKGLFNASTTEVKNTSTESDGKEEITHVKTVNGTTVEKTDDVTKAQ